MSSEHLNTEEEDSMSEEDENQFEQSENLDGGDDGLDLNMSVEAEEAPEPHLPQNNIVFEKNRRNQMFKSKAPAKVNKHVKMANSEDEFSNGGTSEEYSSSETDGEIELPIEIDESVVNKMQNKDLENEPYKLPDIHLPQGEPISVVSIKQEYDDDEMYFRDEDQPDNDVYEEHKEDDNLPSHDDTADNKPKKRRKEKPEVTEEDLTRINVRFSFVCQLCSVKCSDAITLNSHMQESHSDQTGTYMCATCQRVYQSAEDLRTHMLCHIQLGSYECPDCKKIYHHPASLVSHRRRWHRKVGEPHECTECGKIFNLRSDLNTHMKSHTQESFPCKYCDKAFRTDRYLRLHTRHIHFGHKHLKVECKVCHKTFQKKSMVAHMKVHQIGKIHKCHYCGKCVTTHYSLMAHIRRHEGVKPFVCNICDKGFVDKGKLARHVNSHSGTRNYECEICNKAFSEKQYLRQHRRIHEETKEFPCKICGSLFKSMNSVWSHMRKHTQSNKYKCNVCGKTCYRPDHLRSHMISHTGIRDFQCEVCSKRFAKSYDLTEHMRSHSGEKPYVCTLCIRAFARQGEYRKHRMSNYHREREIELGLPPSFPAATTKVYPHHQCGSCDKRFLTTSGLTIHLRKKNHVPKEVADKSNDDLYHDQEGFDEDNDEGEMHTLSVLEELPVHHVPITNDSMGDDEDVE